MKRPISMPNANTSAAAERRNRGSILLGLTAVLLAGTFAGCRYVIPQDGYRKLPERTRDFVVESTNPAPPAYTPGALAGGTSALPKVPANAPANVTDASIKSGEQLFGTVCSACHGQGGVGTAAAPKLADNQWIWLTPDATLYEQIVHRIETGVPQPKEHPGMMPPKGGGSFTDAQVHDIAAYVYALSQQGS